MEATSSPHKTVCLTAPSSGLHKGYGLGPPHMSNVERPLVVAAPPAPKLKADSLQKVALGYGQPAVLLFD